MSAEVKRTDWARFCKRFNTANLYRPARLVVRQADGSEKTCQPTPFMGIAFARKGRSIDGVQFLAGYADADRVVEPIITLSEPEKIRLEKDDDGNDHRLWVTSSADRGEVMLELSGDREDNQARALVEKVAYSLFERRGYTPGNDHGDWLDAETRVKEAELALTR